MPADKATSYVNRGSFEEVVLPLFDRLYRHARHRAHTVEQAEDLLQNALVKAHEKWESYEQGTYALAWVKKIMDNIYLNTVTRGAAKREVTSGDIDPDLLEMDGASRNAPLGRPDLEVVEAISHQEIVDLFNQLPDVAPRGEAPHAELVGKTTHHIQRRDADGAGAAEDAE